MANDPGAEAFLSNPSLLRVFDRSCAGQNRLKRWENPAPVASKIATRLREYLHIKLHGK
jgi:hypothetical protein